MLKNFDESWRAHKTASLADKEQIADYDRRLAENSQRKRKRTRRPHSQRKRAQAEQSEGQTTNEN